VGAELKPDPALAVRLGYNYVTPMYKDGAFKDGTLDSDGSYYSSATDYTNWDATHRITCGVGYNIGKLNISAAYQYTTQKGKFMPFMNYLDNDTQLDDNVANEVSVSNKRHQVLLTLGYTF
jgi:opacity protein-like surface antigen